MAPLVFVLAVTIIKEAIDDLTRFKRDREINNAKYEKLTKSGLFKNVASESIKVGDIIKVKHNERVPADMVLLYTTDKSGAIFIRTDQLDGETDWKLRRPVHGTQRTNPVENISGLDAKIVAAEPNK